jgi:glyoxylase-like metal-dependent hydrolase (beta-lactamase superfamily II)
MTSGCSEEALTTACSLNSRTSPQNEARSLAVIEEANRLVPNKLIKYVVNTHHHFDHAGGLRTYLSQGTTVITHESNKQYYLDIMFYPAARELQPDRMSLYSPMYMISRRPAPMETVASFAAGPGGGAAKYVVTDGERVLEIFHVQERRSAQGRKIIAASAEPRRRFKKRPASTISAAQNRG